MNTNSGGTSQVADTRGVGAFRLGMRLKSLRWPGGRLGNVYRARNAATAAPALVLVPDPARRDGTPLVPLTLRLTACPAPAHIALEVEAAPAQPSKLVEEELLVAMDDMRDTLEAALEQPGTLQDLLTRGVPPPKERVRKQRWHRDNVLLLGAAAAAVLLGLAVRLVPEPPDGRAELELPQATPAVLTFANAEWGEKPVRFRVPDRPLEGQDRAPCDAGQHTINGGCWLKVEGKVPCPKGSAEWKGGCYVPVAGGKQVPMSLERVRP